MPIHHIIPKHEWKERFGNLDGCDAEDNLILLTQEQHIQVHRLLYEQFGRINDKMAASMMEGTMIHSDMVIEWRRKGGRIGILSVQNLPRLSLSEEHKRKISLTKTGMKYKPHNKIGRSPRKRQPLSEKTKQLIAQRKREWHVANKEKNKGDLQTETGFPKILFEESQA